MNPPLQLFGGNDQDTSPTAPDFPGGSLFGDEQFGISEERDDAKRRRIARACDMCRKKKIKCDGKMPACSHCINYKTDCIFTQVEKKRAPPKGAKYIEGLENRLGRMETLLKLSGLLNEEDGDKTDLATLEKRIADTATNRSNGSTPISPPNRPQSVNQNRPPSESLRSTPRHDRLPTPQSSGTSPKAHVERTEEEVEALSDMMCSLVTNNYGESRYIGMSDTIIIVR
ncbi:MAG: hypothetical protein Q9214_000553 [Letrouitia sp. 1 TL-2023]